jgi:hypothetical protein
MNCFINPNGKLARVRPHFQFFLHERRLQSTQMLFVKLIVDIAEHERGFAHTALAEQHYFECVTLAAHIVLNFGFFLMI